MPTARRALLKSIETRREVVAPTRGGLSGERSVPRSWARRAAESVLDHTNIRLVTTTLVAAEVLIGRFDLGLVLVAFDFYLGGLAAREIAILAYLLRGDRLDRTLNEVCEAARAPQRQTDGLALAGDDPRPRPGGSSGAQ